MYLSKSELIRLLEYVPKETSADLHSKILGQLVSINYYNALRGLKKEDRWRGHEEFVETLTPVETEAWQQYCLRHVVVEVL